MEIRRREGLGKDGTNAERTWNERGTRGAGEPTKKGLVTRVFFGFHREKIGFHHEKFEFNHE